MDIYQKVGKLSDKIEKEMKEKGLWQDSLLEAEKYKSQEPFFLDTMTFVQWLQFILLPKVRSIVSSRGDFPGGSDVSKQAVKEFLMYPLYSEKKTQKLLELLTEFDNLFSPQK